MPEELKRRTAGGRVKSTDEDEARLDVSAVGVWRSMQRAFFDVRITNPLAPSYVSRSLESHLKAQEAEKKEDYNTRVVEVEHGTFTPLVFTVAGGCAPEAGILLKTLAQKLAGNMGNPKASTMAYIRARVSFALMSLNTLCLRGNRMKKQRKDDEDSNTLTHDECDCEIVKAEARIAQQEI
jgi:hypothetical protein